MVLLQGYNAAVPFAAGSEWLIISEFRVVVEMNQPFDVGAQTTFVAGWSPAKPKMNKLNLMCSLNLVVFLLGVRVQFIKDVAPMVPEPWGWNIPYFAIGG